jgi:hypothetical protein
MPLKVATWRTHSIVGRLPLTSQTQKNMRKMGNVGRHSFFRSLLELVIIVLIVREINDGKQQAAILQELSANTATTATVLRDVQTTKAAMNGAIQAQNAEANRVLLDMRYSWNWLYLTNTGHPTVFVYTVRTGNLPVPVLTPTPNLSTGQRIQLPAAQVEETFQKALKDRSRFVMPVELDLTDSTGTQYVARRLGKTKLSHESMDKIRDVLSSIMDSAVRYGLLVKNSVEGIRLPKARVGKRSKPFISPAQFPMLLSMDLRTLCNHGFRCALYGAEGERVDWPEVGRRS